MENEHKPSMLERLSALIMREPEDREQLVELLHQAEVQENPDSTPARKSLPVARRSPGTEQFRSKVQSALRFLNKLEEPDLIDLTQNLATTTQYAEVIEDLRDLRERIHMILDAVTVYTSQSNRTRPKNSPKRSQIYITTTCQSFKRE